MSAHSPSLSEVAFDRCEVEVRLPWGANVLHVDAPPSARVTLGTHHWPLDFLGSKSVTIAAEKCTPWDLENDVRVYFAISRLKLFLNPVTFLGFAASHFVVIFPKVWRCLQDCCAPASRCAFCCLLCIYSDHIDPLLPLPRLSSALWHGWSAPRTRSSELSSQSTHRV